MIVKETTEYLKEYQAANQPVENVAALDVIAWRPPKAGWYKVNTDGATFEDIKCCGVGEVIRNERGEIMGHLVRSFRYHWMGWKLKQRQLRKVCCLLGTSD